MNAINLNTRAQPLTDRLTNAQANRISGLGSGIDHDQVIERIVAVQRQRLEPIEARQTQVQTRLDAFGVIQQGLAQIRDSTTQIANVSDWEARIAQSSAEHLVTAEASPRAVPGQYTLVVEKIALNHQLSSQGYASPDDVIGGGTFRVTIGKAETPTVDITLGGNKNTLRDLQQAIQRSSEELRAVIVNDGSEDHPYRLVLVSQRTGQDGLLLPQSTLSHEDAPRFGGSASQASTWQGVLETREPFEGREGQRASSAVARVEGTFNGPIDTSFDFQVVQNGTVGGDAPLELRWNDTNGREGILHLDRFNYAPGSPIPFLDGLTLQLSEGRLVAGDRFRIDAFSERSSTFWWLNEQERAARTHQPTPWALEGVSNAPIISGRYRGPYERQFRIEVEGSGPVGRVENLRLHWQSSNNEGPLDEGTLDVGLGYTPGEPLFLIDGLQLQLEPGILRDGDTLTFTAVPDLYEDGVWFAEDDVRLVEPGGVRRVTAFRNTPEFDSITVDPPPADPSPDRLLQSTPLIATSGEFLGESSRRLTFTAENAGTVGLSESLTLRWNDAQGQEGQLELGESYRPGDLIPVSDGLELRIGNGRIVAGDRFTVDIETSVVQAGQNARVRLGNHAAGEGLTFTSSDNSIDSIIDGVTLSLQAADPEQTVTISIDHDRAQAEERVTQFVEQYNQFAALANELTRFDETTGQAGPLLGDRDLIAFREQMANALIEPVQGTESDLRVLLDAGVKIEEGGLLSLDADTLRRQLETDFEAVADLFQARGRSESGLTSVIGLNEDTRASAEGYPVLISAPPTAASYRSPPLIGAAAAAGTPGTPQEVLPGIPQGVRVNAGSRLILLLNGRRSEPIDVPAGTYALDAYAEVLRRAIEAEGTFASRDLRIEADGDRLIVQTRRLGSRGSVGFEAAEEAPLPPGLRQGTRSDGQDAIAQIAEEPASSVGALLSAAETTPANGLRLFLNRDRNQNANRQTSNEDRIIVTRGVASRLERYLNQVLDPSQGRLQAISTDLDARDRELSEQLLRLEGRLAEKRARLQQRFARLETQLSQARGQRGALAAQLPASGPVPGL